MGHYHIANVIQDAVHADHARIVQAQSLPRQMIVKLYDTTKNITKASSLDFRTFLTRAATLPGLWSTYRIPLKVILSAVSQPTYIANADPELPHFYLTTLTYGLLLPSR